MKQILALAAVVSLVAQPALAWPWDRRAEEAPAAPTPATPVAEGSFADLLASCLQQATAGKLMMRRGRYLEFTCWGAEARAIYDRLGAGVARGDYLEVSEGARTVRYTDKEPGVGHDNCWVDSGSVPQAQTVGCNFTMPVGDVLDEAG
jgi:hypothetical protein